MPALKALDVVALLRDRPELNLRRGWVGTLLLELSPGIWEVEFSGVAAGEMATAALEAGDLLVLQMDPVLA